jgi:hypothetical protein
MAAPRTNSRLRNVCFTVFGVPEEGFEAYVQGLRDDVRVKYFVVGKETCPTTQRPHLQGYLELANQTAFNTVRGLLLPDPFTGNLAARRGSAVQASDYCKKDGRFVEHGEISQPGKRTDITEAVNCLKDNIGTKRPFRAVALAHPEALVKYHRGLSFLANELVEDRDEVPEITVLIGSTGTGKSRRARELCPEAWVWNPADLATVIGRYGVSRPFEIPVPRALPDGTGDVPRAPPRRYRGVAGVQGCTGTYRAGKSFGRMNNATIQTD